MLSKETIKGLFLKAYTLLMADRDTIAKDFRVLADMLGDTTALDEKNSITQKEIDKVVVLNSAFIRSHTVTGTNKEELSIKTAEYDESFKKADAKLGKLRTECQENLNRSWRLPVSSIPCFNSPSFLNSEMINCGTCRHRKQSSQLMAW